MKRTLDQLAKVVAFALTQKNSADLAEGVWEELRRQKKLGQMKRFVELVEAEFSAKGGRQFATVLSSETLDSHELDEIKARLEKKYAAKFELTNEIRDDLIGGLQVKIKDEVIDLSYRGYLSGLKNKLVGAHG